VELWELVARQRIRDTLVPVGARWLIAHRLVSTDQVAPGSVMASPSSIA